MTIKYYICIITFWSIPCKVWHICFAHVYISVAIMEMILWFKYIVIYLFIYCYWMFSHLLHVLKWLQIVQFIGFLDMENLVKMMTFLLYWWFSYQLNKFYILAMSTKNWVCLTFHKQLGNLLQEYWLHEDESKDEWKITPNMS
jgi:hypothetical protein